MRRLGLTIVLLAASGRAFAGSFDLAALRELPDIAALEAGCAPPLLGLALPLPPAQLFAAADPLPPDRKALAWLLYVQRTARNGNPMELVLQEPADAILDRVHAAMAAAGLGAKARLIDQAGRKALKVADLLTMVDMTMPVAFGTKADLGADIVAYVRRTPPLAACLDKARASLPNDARLSVLDEALVAAFAAGADPKSLPGPYRVIWLADQFVGEVDNGGVEQFFSNSSGDDAPETEAALRTLGRADQAGVVSRGMALFDAPYPKDRATRLRQEATRGLGDKLDALTPAANARAVAAAMAAYAHKEDILPK